MKENVITTRVDKKKTREMQALSFNFHIWLHCGSLDRGQL